MGVAFHDRGQIEMAQAVLAGLVKKMKDEGRTSAEDGESRLTGQVGAFLVEAFDQGEDDD